MSSQDLAIIGAACRLPGGVEDLGGFWRRLDAGDCTVTEIPATRWSKAAFFSPERQAPGKSYTWAAGVIDDIEAFDPEFFGLSPREAAQMDPQQRLALELATLALDDAGIPLDRVGGTRTGVFVGVSNKDFGDLRLGDPASGDAYFMTGTALSIVANRISYVFDLRGPSYVVDTACSSSLVALDAACRAVASGDVPLAIVGGVNLLMSPFPFIGFSRAGMLSPRGRCRPFDAGGDGYVRAEGGGFVVVKPLAAAMADGDRVRAVIKATGTNADGRTTGVSLPSSDTQAALIEDVYRRADLDRSRLAYVEAHGTGTAAGDPVEARSIGRVLGRGRAAPLPVGSVKGNIGHLEPASGMAGLIKALLIFEHGRIPPSLFFETPNPAIDFGALNLRVAATGEDLGPLPGDALIGVNSFGFGGANAHAVLAMPPAPRPRRAAGPVPPLLVSAHSAAALEVERRRLAAMVAEASPAALHDLAWTRACRRRHERHRLWLAGGEVGELARQLAVAGDTRTADARVRTGTAAAPAQIVFAFAGNGAQWPGMGRRLLETDAAFRAAVAEIDELFAPLGGFSIAEEMACGDGGELARTEIAQPLLFAFQLGLVASLGRRGVRADAIVGHSVGEVAAARAAGVLSLADAVRVLYHRSRAQGLTRGHGRMLAVSAPLQQVEEALAALGPAVEFAGYNSAEDFTLAGPEPQLRTLAAALEGEARLVKLLDLDYAFHSRAMDPVASEIRAPLDDLRPRRARVAMFSTVTGERVAGPELGGEHWWRNIREPVHFHGALEAVMGDAPAVVVEITPKPVLAPYVRAVARQQGRTAAVVRGMRPDADGADDLRAIVGDVFAHGGAVAGPRRLKSGRHVAPGPIRAFARQHFPVEFSGRGYDVVRPGDGRPLLGRPRIGRAEDRFEWDLDLAVAPWLGDHVVGDDPVLPAAGLLEIALAAAAEICGPADVEHVLAVQNLQILRPMVLEHGRPRRLHVDLQPSDGRLTIACADGSDPSAFAVHAVARVERVEAAPPPARPAAIEGGRVHDVDAFYARVAELGLRYGPAFQRLARLTADGDRVHGVLTAVADEPAFVLSPTAVDAGFQALLALLDEAGRDAFLPVAVERLERHGAAAPARVEARIVRRHRRSVAADLTWWDAAGTVVARASGCRFRSAPGLGSNAEPPARLQTVLRERWRRDDRVDDAPAVAPLVAAARRRVASGPVAERIRSFREEIQPLLAAAAAGYARRAIEPAFARTPSPETIDEIARRLDVPGAARPLLRRLLAILEEDGLIARDEGTWRLVPEPSLPEPEPILRAVVADNPDYAADALLLARAGEALAEKLTFGPGETGEVDALLESPAFAHWRVGSPVVEMSRIALLDGVRAWIAAWPPARPLRVLNLSAGDVGFALTLSEIVRPVRGELVHAASSPDSRAELEPFLRDRPAERLIDAALGETAEIDGGAFDLVLANHVLFMTGDDEQALRIVQRSLAADGLLVLAERQNDRLGDLLFAGQPRWWQPASRRALLPRLGHAQHWIAALEATGFQVLDSVESVDEVEAGEGFHVVAARPHSTIPAVLDPCTRRICLAGLPDEVAETLTAAFRETGLDTTTEAEEGAERIVWIEPDTGGGATGTCACAAVADLVARADDIRAASCVWIILARRAPAPGALPAETADAARMGAIRVLANERPEIAWRVVELRGLDGAEASRALAREIAAREVGESEVVLERGRRLVPRVVDAGPQGEVAAAGPAALAVPVAAGLSRLAWRPITRRQPGPGEVEIAVAAAGLNFRDVMLALGLLGDDAVEDGFAGSTLGMECAGTITAVGEGVDDLHAGDRVVAFASSCFATHVTTPTTAVAPVPAGVSLDAAATVPTVFFSAYYALKHLARLQPGETVLIHGAAGGVGLAAVQVVQALGGEAIVTAGSDEKQAFLRLLGLERLSTSRSLRFVDDVMAMTDGAGVDVVLNSLAGPAIEKSLGLLKPFGRFLELGKRDLYADSPIGLRPFRRNLAYYGIDADQVMAQQPEVARRLFREMLALMSEGALRPIPYRLFEASAIAEAFALMQSARHIGKIVVRLDPPPVPRGPRDVAALPTSHSGDGGWIVVTGGLRGFGFETARWLVRRGARRLALFARRGVDEEAAARIAALRAEGAEIEARALDVTDADEVATALADLRRSAPIEGVFHTAAVFDDGAWSSMDASRISRVMAPKVDGALALAAATETDRLRHFVVYSSATTLIGNPGQANYVAANLALEQLMAERRARGLPGLAVLWGPIADAGYLARNETVKRSLEGRFGRRELTARAALNALGDLLARGDDDRVVAHLDWRRARALPALRDAARFTELASQADEQVATAEAGSLLERIAGLDDEAARATVRDALKDLIAGILRLPAERIVAELPLSDLGLDSLMGVEVGLASQEQLGIELPVSGLGAGTTLEGLVDRVLAQGRGAPAQEAASVATIIARHGAESEAQALGDLGGRRSSPPSKVSLLS